MTRGGCAQPVAVARFGSSCASGVARAALRKNWTIHDAQEQGFVRRVMIAGVAVLVVQLENASDDAARLVSRLSRHWNPVSCIVVGPSDGRDLELAARAMGAAAYVPGSTGVEEIESLALSLVSRTGGTGLATA